VLRSGHPDFAQLKISLDITEIISGESSMEISINLYSVFTKAQFMKIGMP
jgi:hypothetical protein